MTALYHIQTFRNGCKHPTRSDLSFGYSIPVYNSGVDGTHGSVRDETSPKNQLNAIVTLNRLECEQGTHTWTPQRQNDPPHTWVKGSLSSRTP